jgi:hypothetical protein
VLKKDMPEAKEAQKYADRLSQAIKDGFASVERLRKKNGQSLVEGAMDPVSQIAAKSKEV